MTEQTGGTVRTPSGQEIADFLCDAAWKGGWRVPEGHNARTVANEVALILAPWIAAQMGRS